MDTKNWQPTIKSMKKEKKKFTQFLFSLTICLFVIFAAVKFTLIFKPLYYFDIQYLNIVETSNFSNDEIVDNYNYVIDYLQSPMKDNFILPSIPYSKASQIHFHDVKAIFNLLDLLFIITGALSIIGLYINIKNKSYTFFKWSSNMLLALPTLLLVAFATNPDSAFTIFHKIFFRNHYWLLSSKTDPIIKIMPQKFFYHSAIFIGILIILSFILFRILYGKLTKSTSKKITRQEY